jgi:hypothetical protein
VLDHVPDDDETCLEAKTPSDNETCLL